MRGLIDAGYGVLEKHAGLCSESAQVPNQVEPSEARESLLLSVGPRRVDLADERREADATLAHFSLYDREHTLSQFAAELSLTCCPPPQRRRINR